MKTFKIRLLLLLVTLFSGSVLAVTVKVSNSEGQPLTGAVVQWATDYEFVNRDSITIANQIDVDITSSSDKVYVRVIYHNSISKISEISTKPQSISSFRKAKMAADIVNIQTYTSFVEVRDENDVLLTDLPVEFSTNIDFIESQKGVTDKSGMVKADFFPGDIFIRTIINSDTIVRGQKLQAEQNTSLSVSKMSIGSNTRLQKSASNTNGNGNRFQVNKKLCVWKGSVSTDWNNASNWTNNIVAGDYDNVIFAENAQRNLVLDENRVIGSFANYSSNDTMKLVIPADLSLVVTGMVVVGNSNRILVKSECGQPNGSFIFLLNNFQVIFPVRATVEMYTEAKKEVMNNIDKWRWQYFGIPLRSMDATAVNETFGSTSMVRYFTEENAINNIWRVWNDDPATIQELTSFTGYEISSNDTKTLEFRGQLENNHVNFKKKLNYNKTAPFGGQHIFSNPYTAAINIQELEFGNNMIRTVYLYNTGSLEDWQKTEGVAGLTEEFTDDGQYLAVPINQVGVGGLPNEIPSMQGFLVMVDDSDKTGGSTLKIPYRATVQISDQQQRAPSKTKTSSTDKVLTVIDVKGSRFADRVWLFTEPVCTHGFDNGWDGDKSLSQSPMPNLFAMETDGNYQINSADDIDNTMLGFKAGEDTQYTLKFTQHNLGKAYDSVYLIDLLENKTIDITLDGTEYTFTAFPTDKPVKRFKIVTSADAPANTMNNVDAKLKIFSSQQTVFVQNMTELKGDLMLYDLSGRCITKLPFNANGMTTLPVNLAVGTYIAKAITRDQEISTNLIIR